MRRLCGVVVHIPAPPHAWPPLYLFSHFRNHTLSPHTPPCTISGWNIAFYIATFFRGILMISVIALIGAGWSLLKPFLNDREKKLLIVALPLQVRKGEGVLIMGPGVGAVGAGSDFFLILLLILLLFFAIFLLHRCSPTSPLSSRTSGRPAPSPTRHGSTCSR